MGRTISIAIPTFNRFDLLFKSFEKVIDDERVDSVYITDDCSNIEIYEKVVERALDNPKIRIFRNPENYDCYKNKAKAIANTRNEWCCLWDSDNVFDVSYLDRIYSVSDWQEDTAYLPGKALPHFDYSKYEGLTITKENVHKYVDDPTFTCALNTHNHFVNRYFYLRYWDGETNPHTSDSIYMNYLWLKNGGKLYVVPGLTYQHRVDDHEGEENGHYNTNVHKTPTGFHDSIINKLRELK